MKLSIIIPTYKRENELTMCLNALSRQSNVQKKDYEIILVIDGEDETTAKFAKTFTKKFNVNIHIFMIKHQGPAAARNYGIKKSSGEIIVFLDDDALVEKKWVYNILKMHKRYYSECLISAINPYDNSLISNFLNILEYSDIKEGKIINPSIINNASFKRSSLNITFDKRFKNAAGEDIEFFSRFTKVYACKYTKRFPVRHLYRKNFLGLVKQQYHYGRNRYILMKKTNDYPFDKSNKIIYYTKRVLTPFLDPWLRLYYALRLKRNNAWMYLPLGYIQQGAYWSGFVSLLFRKNKYY